MFVVIALVLTTGLSGTALQVVAWAGMLAANLREHVVSEAVAETFDGRHPCCLCKAIAAAKKARQKSDATFSGCKMEFPPTAARFALIPPKPVPAPPQTDRFAASCFPKPPVPPPRSFLA